MEVWRPVVGFEGRYEVSDQGRVRSLDREIKVYREGYGVYARRCRGRVLAPGPHVGGYALIHLYDGYGERHVTTAHQLVAETFLGPCPFGQQVRHLDGNSTNNRVSNLGYGTPAQNAADKLAHGTAPRGEMAPGAQLTAKDVARIRGLRGKRTQQSLADEFGTTFSNISAIQLRKSWSHV